MGGGFSVYDGYCRSPFQSELETARKKSACQRAIFSYQSFEGKLRMWESQLRRNNYSSFPALAQHSNSAVIEKYADEVLALRNVFAERFAHFRRNETLFNIFCSPFDCDVDSAPEDFQMELLEMQSSAEIKGRYASLPLKDFYKYAVSAKDFPNLRKHARKMSLFGSTYVAEQRFSKLQSAKYKT